MASKDTQLDSGSNIDITFQAKIVTPLSLRSYILKKTPPPIAMDETVWCILQKSMGWVSSPIVSSYMGISRKSCRISQTYNIIPPNDLACIV